MKVAFLGPSAPWRGGIAQFAENLAGKFIQTHDEVRMFTFIRQYPDLLFPGGKQTANEGCLLPTKRVLTPYNPFTYLKTIKAIKSWKPDVLIISYWLPFMAPAWGVILRFLPAIKKYYLIHNLDFHEKWLFADSMTRYALQPADGYITLSDVSATALTRLVSNTKVRTNIQLWHPPFEKVINASVIVEQHADAAKPKCNMTMLFFGFIKPYKGLDILLEALPAVLSVYPQLKLIIAGDVYGDKNFYTDKIKANRLSEAVECHFEYIKDDELAGYFERCDVCVLPYRSATQSGVVQMAFAYYKPVIATRVGGISETVKDGINGLLCEPGSHQALADAIIDFYRQSDFSHYAQAIARDNQCYSWDAFLSQLKARL